MRAAVPGCRRARAHYAFARLHYRRLRSVLGHAVLGRCARRLSRCHRGPHNPPPTTISSSSNYHTTKVLSQCGGLEHVDETGLKHGFCTSGTQKRLYLHRNQNETSARLLMRNFPATVRYYPYTIKFAAHRVPRPTLFVSRHWRKHELHAESSRRAQGPLSRAA